MSVSVTVSQAYPPHIIKLSNSSKYDTLTVVTLLSTKNVHLTRCNI